MFNGWHGGGRHQKDNTEIEPISTTLINGVHFDPIHVIRDANDITRSAAMLAAKGVTHSCANCPRQFNKGT